MVCLTRALVASPAEGSSLRARVRATSIESQACWALRGSRAHCACRSGLPTASSASASSMRSMLLSRGRGGPRASISSCRISGHAVLSDGAPFRRKPSPVLRTVLVHSAIWSSVAGADGGPSGSPSSRTGGGDVAVASARGAVGSEATCGVSAAIARARRRARLARPTRWARSSLLACRSFNRGSYSPARSGSAASSR